jgi:nucleoside-diphosphate-sugar epimerase
VLRFGTLYGLSGRTRFDLVVNVLTAKAVVDGQITINGGDQWRPLLHVDDAAYALLLCLEAPLPIVRCQTFNVGSDEQNYTIREIGEIVHRLVPATRVVTKGMDRDVRNYRVCFDKIRQSIGFTPRWTLEQGIEQVVEALRNGRIEDYGDARYSNVKFLSKEVSSCRIRCENGWAQEMLEEAAPGFDDQRRIWQWS